MSTGPTASNPLIESPTLRTDSLADSVLILLGLTVVQRLIGFCRAILFCRWLDAEQLGRWDMAFSFLMLAAPISVLALPGAFRRYVEQYRRRSQLRVLVRRTALACAVMTAAAVVTIASARPWFSRLIFGTDQATGLVLLLAASLLGVIAFHFLFDLFAALRNIRAVAGLQLLSTVLFAALGVGLLTFWDCSASSVVIAYGGACTLSSLVAAGLLMRVWKAFPEDGPRLPHRALWSKLLPFAAWMWATSLMANLFEVADRYMIVHCSPVASSQALAQVGEYHSSRVVPLLLVAVAGIIGSMMMPHLSHDWESGHRDRVGARLNLFLKLFGFAIAALAALILLAAPLLFGVAFRGKFAGGEAVLPWTLAYCVWFSHFMIVQNYLLCREKGHLATVALAVGLAVNVALNLVLLPRLQLFGAVLATTVANVVALALIALFNHRLGFTLDLGARAVMVVPLLLPLGPWVTFAVLLAILIEAIGSDRLLSREEKRELTAGLADYRRRFRRLRTA